MYLMMNRRGVNRDNLVIGVRYRDDLLMECNQDIQWLVGTKVLRGSTDIGIFSRLIGFLCKVRVRIVELVGFSLARGFVLFDGVM